MALLAKSIALRVEAGWLARCQSQQPRPGSTCAEGGFEEEVAQQGPRGFEQILKLAPRVALTARSVALCVAAVLHGVCHSEKIFYVGSSIELPGCRYGFRNLKVATIKSPET